MNNKPDCYKCVHRGGIAGDAHSRCNNLDAKVKAHKHGIANGWFNWPINFDPTWLVSCNKFSKNPDDRMEQKATDSIADMIALRR